MKMGIDELTAGLLFVSQFAMFIGIRLIALHLIRFSWSHETKRLIFMQGAVILLAFGVSITFSDSWSMAVGGVILCVIGLYCLRQLVMRLGAEHRICKLIARVLGGGFLVLNYVENLKC